MKRACENIYTLLKEWSGCKKYLLFVIYVKTYLPDRQAEIQMFENIEDSYFRGNDNPVNIPFYTVSIPLALSSEGMSSKECVAGL